MVIGEVCVYLKLVLQSGGGALAAVLVHYHHHVCQRVHLDLLGLQVALQGLTTNTNIKVTLKSLKGTGHALLALELRHKAEGAHT